jgi:glycosyltransferase involved in cell wall biosynthesis
MKCTLVSTVFNEVLRIGDTIKDLKAQTVQPSEIIITDAGSTDGTYEMLLDWQKNASIPIKILQEKGCNVARGRNNAIKAASYDLIVSTDFGCRFHPLWLASILRPFNDPTVDVVGGTFEVIEADIQTLAAKANYVICDGYYVKPFSGFIPSSRSIAYKKSVWEAIGQYSEWLTLAADDLVFGMVLLKQQHKIVYIDTPYVYWGRHTSIKAYTKEAFRYGLGDGEARVNFRQVISKALETTLRYLFYLWIPIFSILLIKIGFEFWMLIPFISTFLGFRSYYWSFKNWFKYRSPKYDVITLIYSFLLIEQSRIQYMKGYIKGYFSSKPEAKMGATLLKATLR